MDNSKYADLFESIYGFRPKKSGESYELLVAAAIKAVMPILTVKANQFVNGQFSNEKYQLDALIESLQKIVVEAKDYSTSGGKVGRPDVSKLAGALNDLNMDAGIVVSPTDFTRHAKKYADGSKINPIAKPIDLLHVRKSTDEDELGRIKSINIQLVIETADLKNAKWEPIFTKNGIDLLKTLFPIGTRIEEAITAIYKQDGTEIVSIWELTKNISVSRAIDGIVKGEWTAEEQAFVKISGHLVPIRAYKYEFRTLLSEHKIVIEANGNAILLVKSVDGSFDKLVTDTDLRKLKIKSDGLVE